MTDACYTGDLSGRANAVADTAGLAPMPSPLALLRDGPASATLFITHGLGGRITEVRNLVQYLTTPQRIYGLQWQGLDGTTPPHRTVDDMARYFTDAIVSVQPEGPCIFVGLSVGGLVMLEVARLMAASGRPVAFVALVDTYPHARYWPMKCWAEVLVRRTRHHAASIARMSWRDGVAELIRRLDGLRRKIGARHGAVYGWKDSDHVHVPEALRRLRDCGYRAVTQFAPRPYAGKVVFLQAEIPSAFPANVVALWAALVPDMEIYKIQCDHTSLSVTHARHVAGVLERCMGGLDAPSNAQKF